MKLNQVSKFLQFFVTRLASILFILLLMAAASSCMQGNKIRQFQHEFDSGPFPWSAEPFDKGGQEFTFAIFSDLNGGERAGVFEVAVRQLNLLRPELVLCVGDLIDGGTEDRSVLEKQWENFDQRANESVAPIFRVGGNHDFTNSVMQSYFKERYGRTYYSFVYKNVLFLILNSEDYSEKRMQEIYLARAKAIQLQDSGKIEESRASEYYSMPERVTGEIGDEQNAYFEEVLRKYPDVKWTFIFLHKPVWQRKGEGGLARLEAALADRPYTLFNGHLHKYSRTERNSHDYIMLSTTGGSQDPRSTAAFDGLTLVTVTESGPSVATIKMAGLLDISGNIPGAADTLCFQASECIEN